MNSKNKFFVLLVILCIQFSLALSVSAEKTEKPAIDYKVIVDFVYEWSPQGEMIQIGDYLISDLGSVMLDNGSEPLIPVSKGKIKTGSLVRAMLISEDKNGAWKAGKIIVLAGKALASAEDSLSGNKKKELKAGLFREDSEMPLPRKQDTRQPYLEDGVWKY